MKKIEGYVSKTMFKLFDEGKVHYLNLLRKPLKDIDVHVTLSLVEDPECSRREPDYKAMWEDLEQDFNGTYAFRLSTKVETLKSILKKIKAEHTPQGDQPTEVKEKKL